MITIFIRLVFRIEREFYDYIKYHMLYLVRSSVRVVVLGIINVRKNTCDRKTSKKSVLFHWKRVKHDGTTKRLDAVILVFVMRLGRFIVVRCFYRYCKIICRWTSLEIELFNNDRLSRCFIVTLFGTLLISYSPECY